MEILAKQRLEASYELDAMATIYRDAKGRFSIAVNPDPNRQGDEYFKLYNNAKKSAATKVARIMFRSAKYVYHTNYDGKEDWILNAKEKKYLVTALKKKAKHPYEEYTNWQKAILLFNDEKDLDQEKTLKNLLPKPKYKNYLPFNLEMPDYTKLGE